MPARNRIAVPPIRSSPRRMYAVERAIQKAAVAAIPTPYATGAAKTARTMPEAKRSRRGRPLRRRATSNVSAGNARIRRLSDAQIANQHAEAEANRTNHTAYPRRPGPYSRSAPHNPLTSKRSSSISNRTTSSRASQAQRGTESGATRVTARIDSYDPRFHPSRAARSKIRSGTAFMDRMALSNIARRSARTSRSSTSPFPGPAAPTTRIACRRTDSGYPGKRSAATRREGSRGIRIRRKSAKRAHDLRDRLETRRVISVYVNIPLEKKSRGRIPEIGGDHGPPPRERRLRVGPRPDPRNASSIPRGRDARSDRRDPWR